MFYNGKICSKHPEAGGLRYASCRKCVPCHNVVNAQTRRNTIKAATPAWADKKEIARIYRRASKLSKVVDHVIPLNHPKVCGLHVSNNLKIVTVTKNLAKSNKFRILTLKVRTK